MEKLKNFNIGEALGTLLVVIWFVATVMAGLQLFGVTAFDARAMKYIGAGLLGYSLIALCFIAWAAVNRNNNKKG